jgi:hypothetical protein
MTDNIVTDGAGIAWRITDPATGRAERITPLPGGSTSRRPAQVVRYFPPAATTAPVDHGLPTSVRTVVILGMLEALLSQHPQLSDGARRWLDSTFADTPQSLRDEVFNAWDQRRMGA